MDLDESQWRVVTSSHPVIAVVAGPGSGKTRTLVERIRHQQAPNKTTVVLTYTNAAADELTERLQGCPVSFIGTLHGYCFRLLQLHGALLGYRLGTITIVTEDVAESMLTGVIEQMGWKKSRAAFDRSEDRLATTIRKEYAQRLKRANMVDFDTVLEAAARIIAMVGKDLCIDDLFVDEVQDSAKIDWVIYHTLPAVNKFYVGDPEQSIFGFRGAHPLGFKNLCLHSQVEIHFLQFNYRSTRHICKAAERLIAKNGVQKVLIPERHESSPISVQAFQTSHDELRVIAGTLVASAYSEFPEVAVLCRTNWLREQFKAALEAAGTPVAKQERVALPFGWQHGINVLAMWLDPRNDLIAERVYSRCLPAEKLEECKQLAARTGKWLSEVIANMHFGILEDGSLNVSRMHVLLVSAEMIDLVNEHWTMIRRRPGSSFPELLSSLYEYAKGDKQESVGEGVHVCTLHGFKGREADVVFIPGCEEELMPSKKIAADPALLEEERRLFFVGITRARTQLWLSYARQRQYPWGPPRETMPSRFIEEATLP